MDVDPLVGGIDRGEDAHLAVRGTGGRLVPRQGVAGCQAPHAEPDHVHLRAAGRLGGDPHRVAHRQRLCRHRRERVRERQHPDVPPGAPERLHQVKCLVIDRHRRRALRRQEQPLHQEHRPARAPPVSSPQV